ncbi:hypothetical protein AAU61_02965 [Desulfocarbo indianensis]|nr:hypothetical protein AAU61_02965 [Desulfocarbo indianensis]
METLEFTGKNTEEALTRAVEHFGLPLDKLQVEVVSAGSSGLLGFIGAKKAKVLVRPLADSAKEAMDEVMREFRGQEAAAAAPSPPAPAAPAEKRPPKPPEPRAEVAAHTAAAPAPAPAAEAPEAGRPAKRHAIADYSDEPPEQSGLTQGEDQEEDYAAPGPEADNGDELAEESGASAREPESPEVVETSRQVLERIVKTLDDNAQVVAMNGRNSGIELEIEGGEVGILIGRRGQTLEALQYLTTRIVSHQQGRPVRINVDAGGYRRRRRESLEDLALRMAGKARNTRRPVSIGPLSSPERRLVHLALKNENGVTTSSRGRGEMKKVLISPRN